ncbi:MAG TPA: tRNA 2-thiouridine(34) synthase MnmA [Candidatus Krumholzibacteria bacterium]|nr:tRNA 2-thiouridine(34) synthase MnmA [Candidatus Krumholzibacteria bacterium]HPD72712.1 tRNA 2-thiouridine(34) synthase MnmA [Candidatus Krumholzibacteria bacterium]HRY40356.1 tRNA 2-thiouridine(34) synthase MnmA [Candidatus Krumholzibacteria bacterium]
MTFPVPIPGELRRALPPGSTVLLALSGGVDSALALAVLRELGCDVLAVTFKNFCYADQERTGGDQACCSVDAIADARALAARFGARHWVHDVTALFSARVIEPFVAEYAVARTPNPCLACNSGVRFPELVRLADAQGCDLVATGHYARTRRLSDGGAELLRGVDPQKDQSYFLSQVAREVWPRIVFPLGWSTKTEVRAAARALRLPVADKPESQEICFVPDRDRGFLFAGQEASRPGPIVDTGGRVLGEHRGLIHYTVGQRRGLNIAHPEPLYVLALEAADNRLIVGPREQLAVRSLACDRFAPAVADLAESGPADGAAPCIARVRHRHAGARVARWRRRDDRLQVDLAEPVYGAAPGQGLTLYEGDRVLGGGRLVGAASVSEQRS